VFAFIRVRTMIRTLFAALCFATSATPAFAGPSYMDGFLHHWKGAFTNQSSIVLLALGVGAVGILIITRSRGKK